MDHLEDSTLDLIFRRRVRSYFPGYLILLIILGSVMVLPLVEVDVVTTTRGMIRPLHEPVDISSPLTGILDSTILENNLQVTAGDTLVWIRRDIPRTRIEAYQNTIETNQDLIRDIRSILEGKIPALTTRYLQSYRNHLSTLSSLQLQEKFLHDEFQTAKKLFEEEVISMHEYEEALSQYQIICARISDTREQYRYQLEEELYQLRQETRQSSAEIALIHSTSRDYYVLAPVSGAVLNCPGINAGSVIHSGTSMGTISPSGNLVAECYLPPGIIPVVKMGTRVKLRFDHPQSRFRPHLEAVVDYMDKDITSINGNPVCRIRCSLENPRIQYANGTQEIIRKGMTFTANIILFRQSLANLILDRANRWANPAESVNKG